MPPKHKVIHTHINTHTGMSWPPPPPRRHLLLLLLLLVLLPTPSSPFFLSPLLSTRRRHTTTTTITAAAHVDTFSSTTPSTTTTTPATTSPYLVLFKGGVAGNADEGTSLACLRYAEFRALAQSIIDPQEDVEEANISFTNALKTDLSLAAGFTKKSEIVADVGADDDASFDSDSSLVYVHGITSREVLQAIVSRTILCIAAYEIWASGDSLQACADAANNLDTTAPAIVVNSDTRSSTLSLPHLIQSKGSWAARNLVFGSCCGRRKSLTNLTKKLAMFETLLRALPGEVDLRTPEAQLVLLEDGDVEEGESLHQAFLVREIAQGNRGLTERLSLKHRPYVTTTSMDPKTSLVMTNIAGLQKGDRVLDAMAGGGGLLLAAAQLGAGMTVGVDVNTSIDLSKVHSNFEALDLPVPQYVFGDVGSRRVQQQLRDDFEGPFDVILSDPPYGKREKGGDGDVGEGEGVIEDATRTLIELAASDLLRVGGRLTFFIPAHPSLVDILPSLPRHGCLSVESSVPQPLNANLNRWLVTFRKRREARAGEDVTVAVGVEEELVVGGPEKELLRPWHYNAGGGRGGGRKAG